MKKTLYLCLILVMTLLCGCSWQLPDVNDPSYKYLYRETELPGDSAIQIPVADNTFSQQETSSDTVENSTEMPYSEEESSASEVGSAEPPVSEIVTEGSGEIDLSIVMPQQNGSMYTDSSADNKFIIIVNEEKGINKELLVAVYSLPDTGQNYVFEFYTVSGRTVNDLRRVYLIDENGKIVSVSAVNSSERVGIGSVENWFSMNVLIKEVIFPAISESIKK